MLETTTTSATPRRPRTQPHLLTGAEDMILRRMQRIDRGEGCHATVERIGRSVDDKHISYSISQTRRYLRRLRELGHIYFAGQTAGGRNATCWRNGSIAPTRCRSAPRVPSSICSSYQAPERPGRPSAQRRSSR